MFMLHIKKISMVLLMLLVFSHLQGQQKIYCRQNQQTGIEFSEYNHLIDSIIENAQLVKILKSSIKNYSSNEITEKLLNYIFSFDTSLTENHVYKEMSGYLPYFYHNKYKRGENSFSYTDPRIRILSINLDNQIWTPYRNDLELPSQSLHYYVGVDFKTDSIARLIGRIGGDITRNTPYYWFKIKDSLFNHYMTGVFSDADKIKYLFYLCLVSSNSSDSNIQVNFFRRINTIDSILMKSKSVSLQDKVKWYLALYKISNRDKSTLFSTNRERSHVIYLMKAQHISYTNPFAIDNETYLRLKNIIENDPTTSTGFGVTLNLKEALSKLPQSKSGLDKLIIALNRYFNEKEEYANVETIVQQQHDNSILCLFTIIGDYFDANKELYGSESYFHYLKLLQRYCNSYKVSVDRKYQIDVQALNQIYRGIENSSFICSKNDITNSIIELVSTLIAQNKIDETNKWIRELLLMHNQLIFKTDITFYKPQYDSDGHIRENIASIVNGYKKIKCFNYWRFPQERHTILYLMGYCLSTNQLKEAGELSYIFNIVEGLKNPKVNFIEATLFYQEKAESQFKITEKQDTIQIYSELITDYFRRLAMAKNNLRKTSIALDNETRRLESVKLEKKVVSDSIGTIKQLNFKLDSTNSVVTLKNTELEAATLKLKTANFRITAAFAIACILLVGLIFLSTQVYRNNKTIKKQKEFALKQESIAKGLADLAAYKAKTWQEFGHIPNTAISDAYFRMEEGGISDYFLSPLVSLHKLVKHLFNNLQSDNYQTGTPINQEIALVNHYLEYVNVVKEKNINLEIIGEVPDITLPSAILLSCVKNAISHGGLLTKNNGEVGIEIKRDTDGYYCNVYDNGKGFPENIKEVADITTGTGLKNANNLLRFFNKNSTANFVSFKKCSFDIYSNCVTLKFLSS